MRQHALAWLLIYSFGFAYAADNVSEEESDSSEAASLPSLLAAEYFKRNEYAFPKISPNGRYVLIFKTNDGLRELNLLDPINATRLPLIAEERGNLFERIDIFNAHWVDDEYIVFTYKYSGRHHMALGRVVFTDGAPTDVKVSILGTNWDMVDPMPNREKRAIIVDYNKDSPRLFNIDVTNAEGTLKGTRDRNVQNKVMVTVAWLMDSAGHFRAGLEVDHEKQLKTLWYRKEKDRKWVAAWEGDPAVTITPVLIGDEDRRITVISDEFSEFAVLTSYDWRTKTYGDTIFEVEGRDIDSAAVDPAKTRVVSVSTIDDGLVQVHYIGHASTQYPELLESETYGSAPYIVGQSLNENFAIIQTSTNDDPGAFFLLDVNSKISYMFGQLRPWLSKFRLGKSQIITTQTEDGLTIESYLTLPDSESYPRPPLIVMPHGGPISIRDTQHFNAAVQMLATLGYATLQTNYRGSSGYGKSFQDKGEQEWGRAIENDIDAALRSVHELNLVNAEKTCIYGASYGGYSALISAIRSPQQYKCAASYAGVTDMTLLFHEFGVNHSNLIRASVERIVGDPSEHMDSLIQYSPVFNADKIEVPIFLAHGENDSTVDIEHFYRMKKMLDYHGIESEYLVLEDEGHGFHWVNSTMNFYERLDAFFRSAMGLPEPSLNLILREGEEWIIDRDPETELENDVAPEAEIDVRPEDDG